MKSHKYWSIGALITMLGTFYTGYKGSKECHKYFAASSLLCMIMAIYTGHKMISGKSRKKKESCATALAGHRAAILFNLNLSNCFTKSNLSFQHKLFKVSFMIILN